MSDVQAEKQNDAPYFLMCSGCRTPCSGTDSHVIPHWNPTVRRILTTYWCGNCWIDALAETRTAVKSGEAEVLSSFCDFLANQGFGKDAETMRGWRSEQAQAQLLAILDATEEGKPLFHP